MAWGDIRLPKLPTVERSWWATRQARVASTLQSWYAGPQMVGVTPMVATAAMPDPEVTVAVDVQVLPMAATAAMLDLDVTLGNVVAVETMTATAAMPNVDAVVGLNVDVDVMTATAAMLDSVAEAGVSIDISYIATGANGVGSSANLNQPAPATPGMPAGTAVGDRVYVFQVSSIAPLAPPAGWTTLYAQSIMGSGAPAASSGMRYASCYYRDYDGVWTMSAFSLNNNTENSQMIRAITLRKSGGSWNAPTVSAMVQDSTTAHNNGHVGPTAFPTVDGGHLMLQIIMNDQVNLSGQTLSVTDGATTGFGVRLANSSAAGKDISQSVVSAEVTTGGTTVDGTITSSFATAFGGRYIQQTAS